MAILDLSQSTFGRLTPRFPWFDAKRVQGMRWLCRCLCGNITVARTKDLRNGNTTSCGCLRLETLRSEGGRGRAQAVKVNLAQRDARAADAIASPLAPIEVAAIAVLKHRAMIATGKAVPGALRWKGSTRNAVIYDALRALLSAGYRVCQVVVRWGVHHATLVPYVKAARAGMCKEDLRVGAPAE